MANSFIPYDIKIKDITTNSVQVSWDVHNIAEFAVGTYYKVYVRESQLGPVVETITANTTSTVLELKWDTLWVSVTSIYKDQESAESSIVEIKAKIGATDSASYVTIAVDPEGTPVKLRVNTEGALVVADGMSGIVDNLATESTLLVISGITDQIRVGVQNLYTLLNAFKVESHSDTGLILSAIASTKSDIVTAINATIPELQQVQSLLNSVVSSVDTLRMSTESGFTSTGAKIDALTNEVSAIKDRLDSGCSVLLRASTELFNVSASGGTTVVLPWSSRSIVKQVTVIHESGSATDFMVEVWSRNFSISERDVVLRQTLSNSYSSNRLDFIHSVPYINMQGNDEIVVKVLPNQGTSNNFYVVINGEKAR